MEGQRANKDQENFTERNGVLTLHCLRFNNKPTNKKAGSDPYEGVSVLESTSRAAERNEDHRPDFTSVTGKTRPTAGKAVTLHPQQAALLPSTRF